MRRGKIIGLSSSLWLSPWKSPDLDVEASEQLISVTNQSKSDLRTKHFDVSSHFGWEYSSLTLYMTFLKAVVVRMNQANYGCTALYCTCAHKYRTGHLYFDLHFCLAPKFRLLIEGSDNQGLDNCGWTVPWKYHLFIASALLVVLCTHNNRWQWTRDISQYRRSLWQ